MIILGNPGTVSLREDTPLGENLEAEPDSLFFDLNANLSDYDEDNIPLGQLMTMVNPQIFSSQNGFCSS